MSLTYLGQIMMTGFGFPPKHFALCNGQTLAIQQNQALFSLLGTTYGGNGVSTFMLPNLAGRTPVGGFPSAMGGWPPSPYSMGQSGGTESVALLPESLPTHTHQLLASSGTGTALVPTNNQFGATSAGPPPVPAYGKGAPNVGLAQLPLASTGGGAPHTNLQPYTTISMCICLAGVFPSRN